jgi:hypothetical protein
MTVKEYTEKQKKKLSDFKSFTVPFEKAVRSTLIGQTQRIFVEGKNSSNSPIGKYNSTSSLYVNPNTTPGQASKLKPPHGKNGDTIFKNGKAHKTTYVESYKALRKEIGFSTNVVNLRFTSEMFFDFTNAKTAGAARPTKISDTEYQVRFKKPVNAKKADGLEDHFQCEIFKLTKSERSSFFKTLEKEFHLALTK